MRPFRKRDKARLIRVCNVVRERLGLGSLLGEYEFADKCGTTIAHTMNYNRGWRCRIQFFDRFFEDEDLERQLQIVVHEHIHVALHAIDQTARDVQRFVRVDNRKQYREQIDIARELAVDHLSKPMLDLLWPFIKKVL